MAQVIACKRGRAGGTWGWWRSQGLRVWCGRGAQTAWKRVNSGFQHVAKPAPCKGGATTLHDA